MHYALSDFLSKPPLPSPIMLHFPVALSGANSRQPHIEFLNILIIP